MEHKREYLTSEERYTYCVFDTEIISKKDRQIIV